MQNIVDRWQALPREDLFQFWQDELALKKELRNELSGYREIKINNAAEYNFLRQSLAYGEHRELFYTILFFNMNHQPVQYALLNGPIEQYQELLHFLPPILRNEKPYSRSLQFIINIYREDYHACFIDIGRALTESDCAYLMARTARQPLRQLLRKRQLELVEQNNLEHYGLLNPLTDYPKYPTLFGDKIQIINSAITSISRNLNEERAVASNISELESLLETADLLFKAGLLNDCLTVLLLLYKQQDRQEISSSQEDNNLFLKSLNKILHKSLPAYYLLSSPTRAYQHSLESYQLYFPRLLGDETSWRYLDLYATLLANYEGNPYYTLLELTQNNEHKDNEVDTILINYLLKPDDLSGDACLKLSQIAHAQITSSPHESFVIMEIMRWLERVKIITFSREISNRLLHDYLQLFQWIPSPMFLNTGIRKQLSRGEDNDLLDEVDRLISFKNQYSFTGLREIYAAKTSLGINNKDRLGKQLLLGSFLGVF